MKPGDYPLRSSQLRALAPGNAAAVEWTVWVRPESGRKWSQSKMSSGFRSAVRIRTSEPFALSVAICGMLLSAVGCHQELRKPITQTSQAAQTLRSAVEKHHLLIGAAVDSPFLAEAQYRETLAREYSAMETANELKFDAVHPKPEFYDFSGPDALVAFARMHSMKLRGHNLLWHRSLPNWIVVNDWMHAQNGPSAAWTAEALNKVLAGHIATVVKRYRGDVYAWDVVNEPFNEDGSMRSSIWYDKPGIGFAGKGTTYIAQALIWAHAADPEARLFVNEYNAETLNKKSDSMYEMAKDFLGRGIPLNGIGLQLHVESDFNEFDALRQNIHRLAGLGLEVQFTEVDVRLRDDSDVSLRAEADIYKRLLGECLREPACTLFQSWGFTDKYSFIPGAFPGYGWGLPFDETYRKKPAYSAILEQLQSQSKVAR
jgi:endo-1,4-beta-xylanase